MSLLLNALKKAALEKQKAEAGANKSSKPSVDDAMEFSLDETETVRPAKKPLDELTLEQRPERLSTTTVSDEALEMLVYKTNKQYRKNRRNIWAIVFIGVFIILGVGGIAQYYGMLQDVEGLERKHKLAMQAVKAQPVVTTRSRIFQALNEAAENKTGQDSVLITDPTGESSKVGKTANTEKRVDKRVDKRQQSPERKKSETIVSKNSLSKRRAGVAEKPTTFSINKTQKLDPVNSLLSQGWQAYVDQDYEKSSISYQQVLGREPDNRDALLGVAAIAVKQGDHETARYRYAQILKLDPRDQVAASAIANLNPANSDAREEVRIKRRLMQQPEAAHLHFALGNIYAQQGAWQKAQSEYFSAWQVESENADYNYNLAVSLDQIGKQHEASRFYNNCLDLVNQQNVSFSVDSVRNRLQQIASQQ